MNDKNNFVLKPITDFTENDTMDNEKKPKRHKWNRPLKSFADAGSYCLVCGIQRERHGTYGIWYSNKKTGIHGYEYQGCVVE